jgi:hypothetical protein
MLKSFKNIIVFDNIINIICMEKNMSASRWCVRGCSIIKYYLPGQCLEGLGVLSVMEHY